MEELRQLIEQIPSIREIIEYGGLTALIIIVFAETGLLAGFFLPGDSLLVTAGVFAAAGYLNVWMLLITLTIAAVVGDAVGYSIGRRAGPLLFRREDSRLFKKKHLLRAKAFYEKHGGKTIIIARFVPIIRTFAPTVAGAAEMPYSRFAMFNIVGGVLWVWSMVLAGYSLRAVFGLVLGREVTEDEMTSYLHYVIVVVVFLSLLPAVFEWWRERRKPHEPAAVAVVAEDVE
jgi:membrane-associated protein